MLYTDKQNIPIVILCGGNGIYVDDSGQRVSKSLVMVDQEPLLYYVMLLYLRHGFRRFILSTGMQLEKMQQIFALRYGLVPAKNSYGNAVIHGFSCEVMIYDSGLKTSTGDRIKQLKNELIAHDTFGVTYSDTIADLNLADVYEYHINSGKIASLVGTKLPTRFRVLGLRHNDPLVRGFAQRPVIQQNYINGGFYFFNQQVFREEIFPTNDPVNLETDVLEYLIKKGELIAYLEEAAWQYLDCERDLSALIPLAQSLKDDLRIRKIS